MINEYTAKRPVLLSLCDCSGKLSVTGTLDIFMDMATLHEEASGFGVYAMLEKGLYWIVGKNRIHFTSRPKMMDDVVIKTFFMKPSRLFVNREYRITDKEGRVLVTGETEWLVATENCEKLVSVRDYIPGSFEYPEKALFEERMKKVSKDFSPEQLTGKYEVRPTDVDFVGHMNNAAYSRAVMSFIPNSELKGREIKDVEIFYALQCKEGDVLSIYRRDTENGMEFGAFLEDGRNVMTARLLFASGEEKA
ncbi:MAG: hypothetical protein J5528_00240 [Firmicutes bacterium]|nr:hypothetical protein [Bacillota bacterium]